MFYKLPVRKLLFPNSCLVRKLSHSCINNIIKSQQLVPSFSYTSKKLLFCQNKLYRMRLFSSDVNISNHQKHSWRVQFYGTDNFSVECLKSLMKLRQRGLLAKLDVVTVPIYNGKPTQLHQYCDSVDVTVQLWPIKVPEDQYDIGIVASFGKLITPDIITAFPLGMLNVHASLLPRWRGAAPIIHAILNGDNTTGVTIVKIHPFRFDNGEVISINKVPIHWKIKSEELKKLLAKVGSIQLFKTMSNLLENITNMKLQETDGITTAHKITKEDARINWSTHTCCQIQCMYRAFDDYIPVWTTFCNQKLSLKDMVLLEDHHRGVSTLSYNNTCSTSSSENSMIKENHNSLLEHDISSVNLTTPGTATYVAKYDVLSILCKDGLVSFKKVSFNSKWFSARIFNSSFMLNKLDYPDLNFI